MFLAARSLMFSSLTRMRQLSTSNSVKDIYVNNSEEFTERVVNNQRPIVLMFTNKTDYDCLHNEVIMDRAIAATGGTVDLVKVERTRINIRLDRTIERYFEPHWDPFCTHLTLVYTIEHGRVREAQAGLLDDEMVADLLKFGEKLKG